MLRSILQDSAISTAKAHAHPQVECRHVLFAVVKHFRRGREDVASLFSAAKDALKPPGTSTEVPTLSPEATALLDSFSSEGDAVAAILSEFTSGQAGEGARAPSQQTERAPEEEDPSYSTDTPEGRPAVENEKTEAVLADLEGLVGLDSVKHQVSLQLAVVQANATRQAAGLPSISSGLHLVFSGPPGTGKTTVARLVARLYASTDALPSANFTEATRSDLVAAYVGQTAMKTSKLIERTRPGVLFIDEAYSLTPTHESDYGAEAIATLVKAMEDHRDDFAVIIAGYGEEMSKLIASNPGLRSRFKTFIDFPDYTPEELAKIFMDFAHESNIALAAGVLAKATEFFQQAAGKESFGNARYARSLFENAYAQMSARAAADGVVELEELTEITLADIERQDDGIRRTAPRIGFGQTSLPVQDE
jgi:stage V sporulation protein K